MGEVLEPLKVRDGDTAGVQEHVRDDQDALAGKDVVGVRRDRAVGGLGHKLALEALGVGQIDLLLAGGRDEEVAE